LTGQAWAALSIVVPVPDAAWGACERRKTGTFGKLCSIEASAVSRDLRRAISARIAASSSASASWGHGHVCPSECRRPAREPPRRGAVEAVVRDYPGLRLTATKEMMV
jgi:hypothetical protein